MRNELLADRPTENHDLVAHRVHATTSSALTSRIASSTRSIVRSGSATYLRARDLPLRTLFLIVLSAYVLLTAAVVFGSPLDIIDRAAAAFDLAHRFPHAASWLLRYVMLGQRGPSSHVAFVYLVYRAIRQRSWRPLILFVTALTMLNVTVGTVKLATGRLGPALTTHPRAVFDGGDIFPSGHTSNAVVIFGVLAMVALEYRRAWIALAVFVSTTVGLSTIFLDTHWVTDVLGGWLAGALVLLALPATYALIERWALRVILAVREWFRPAPITLSAATWEALPRRRDLTSEMLTEDAMYR
jgi:membrane-associated phospholipid phosphatase